MSKVNYRYGEFEQPRYWFDFYDNEDQSLTWMDILEKERDKGAVGIINLSYFLLSDGSFQSAVKLHGEWKKDPKWLIYGIGIDKDGKLYKCTYEDTNAYSFTEGCPAQYINGEKGYGYTNYATNGNTYIGFKPDGTVCLLLCDKDHGQTSAEADAVMLDHGCTDIIRMDGSWSSHGQLGLNEVCSPSQYRYDRLYLVIYDSEYTPLKTKYKVWLDPYGNFDKKTHPNTWAMLPMLQRSFNRCGIEAVIGCYEDCYNFDSALRAKQCNNYRADICLSIDADTITGDKARVTSSFAGANAGRNIMGSKLIKAFKEANIPVENSVSHDMNIIMLAKTNSTANFIRYNDGLLSTDYIMNADVEATVKGICDYLSVEYIPDEEPDTEPTPEPEEPVEEEKSNFYTLVMKGIFSSEISADTGVTYGELADIFAKLGLIPDSPQDE